MSPINTSSHSCAVHGNVKVIIPCNCCIWWAVYCGNRQVFSMWERHLHNKCLKCLSLQIMDVYHNATSIPLSPIVYFNALSLYGYFTISMAVLQPCFGDTQDVYVVAPDIDNMSHLFDFVI